MTEQKESPGTKHRLSQKILYAGFNKALFSILNHEDRKVYEIGLNERREPVLKGLLRYLHLGFEFHNGDFTRLSIEGKRRVDMINTRVRDMVESKTCTEENGSGKVQHWTITFKRPFIMRYWDISYSTSCGWQYVRQLRITAETQPSRVLDAGFDWSEDRLASKYRFEEELKKDLEGTKK